MSIIGDSYRITSNITSTLDEKLRAASYDNMASGYDLLVGNGIYNRLIWGCSKAEYHKAVTRFFGRVSCGPVIDFGCGSCVFTSSAYAQKEARLTLFDRSLGMLHLAAKRLPQGQFLQGDALKAPFEDNSFVGAMGWGMFHVFGSQACYLSEMHRITVKGGFVAVSSLALTDRKIGNRMLRLLEKQGEAVPETSQQITNVFARYFETVEQKQVGNMLFLAGIKSRT
jgi:ubiquinone/menaquinone biosynthesis C-methylase UbiE